MTGYLHLLQCLKCCRVLCVCDYDRDEAFAAKKEGREPCFLPKISPHILRHTFCARMCENESNIKLIQDVMGHKNIHTTMDVYDEATAKKKKEIFQNAEGKFRLV